MKKRKKALLFTGGTGFLGSHILKSMVDSGDEIIVLKRSTSNLTRIKEIIHKMVLYDIDVTNPKIIFSEHKIDKIIHCATNYGRRFSNPIEIIEANLILPLKLLDLGEKHDVNCFINTDTILDKRISSYSLSKSQFRQWLDMYSSKMVCINIELEHFFGPNDDDSKFVSYIIHNLLNEVEKIDLTEGNQKRYFIYIDDVVDAFMKIIDYSDSLKEGLYNFPVGSQEAIEIRKFVKMAKFLTNNTKTFLHFGALPYRKNEIMEFDLDLSQLEKLGWQPKISLEEGLKRTIETDKKILKK